MVLWDVLLQVKVVLWLRGGECGSDVAQLGDNLVNFVTWMAVTEPT